MVTLDTIKQPLAEDLQSYEGFLTSTLRSDIPFIKTILDYIVSNRGKGIRPLLTMLMAHIHSSSGTIGKRSYLAAMLVEMIHMASLIHDDVIDESDMRHGKQSINGRWGTQTSVLAGDLLLSQTFSSGMSSGQYDLVSYICSGITSLCEGELLQNDHSSRLDLSREEYLDIIFRKTATLIGISCGVGALSAGASSRQVGIARQTGINLGMAFQIKDDILDFSSSSQTGKPSCADLKERKITLPLLVILERSTESNQAEIKRLIDKIAPDNDNIERLCGMVMENGGIEQSLEVMNGYLDDARKIIATYGESPYRTALMEMCDFIGQRNK